MEASPNRPGHAGHTPQPVAGILSAARVLGQLTSSAVKAAIEMPRPIATAALPRLQVPERQNALLALVQSQEAARVLDARQPWPFTYREGFADATAPRRAT